MFLGHEQRRTAVVDEARLVERQLRRGGPAGVAPGPAHERLGIVEPQLGHAVEALGGAPAGGQHGVHRTGHGVHLHVAPDPQRRRVARHERRVLLAPVPVELLGAHIGPTTEAEDQLHHGARC